MHACVMLLHRAKYFPISYNCIISYDSVYVCIWWNGDTEKESIYKHAHPVSLTRSLPRPPFYTIIFVTTQRHGQRWRKKKRNKQMKIPLKLATQNTNKFNLCTSCLVHYFPFSRLVRCHRCIEL